MTSANGLPTIMTLTGRTIDFINPDPYEIAIEDIAHGLAQECRFARQCRTHYSVAQHSVMVTAALEKTEPWNDGSPASIRAAQMALLHDATEAYMGDIPRPLKQLLPDYKAIEIKLHKAIAARFGLVLDYVPRYVKEMDNAVLAAEGAVLMPVGWDDFSGLARNIVEIVPLPAMAAKELFLIKFDILFGNIA